MKGLKVSSRYAQSLIELSEEMNKTDKVLEDMKYLVSTTKDNRDFLLFLNSPLVKADKKSDVLKRLFGGFDELSLKFMTLLTKNEREDHLPLIAEEYINQVNKLRGIVSITISSARKIDENVKETILKKLNNKSGETFDLTEKVDESLIGGFVARIGDTRVDASVLNQLSEMKKRLIRSY